MIKINKKIKNIFFLDKSGVIIGNVGSKSNPNSSEIFPIVVDYYPWDIEKQNESAEKYKDKIKRVFYPEKIEAGVEIMLKDDIQRLKLVSKFNYGKKVLEIGCSDGSVSIKIAGRAEVKEILAIDIRQSAINDGKKLLRDLVKKEEIKQAIADKIELKKYAIEDLPECYGQYDSVCAYEIFEHLTPWDFMPAFKHLYKFIKPNGKFFISVPNRFPNTKYDMEGRSRWKWFDHRNFFSQASLELLLTSFFNDVKFYSLYPNEKNEESIYLICECHGKKT